MDLDIIKERLKCSVRNNPAAYYSMHRLRGKYLDVAVDRTTQLVIEGFPRSGNTFAVVAFQRAQRERINIAHHLHVPAQVIRAARWRMPSLVLIRNPTDTVISLVLRHPHLSVRRALLYYASFYETVARYRKAYVLGTFEEVTSDYGAVIERINDKFGTGFVPFKHSEDNVRDVFSLIEEIPESRGEEGSESRVARLSEERRKQKDSLKEELGAPKYGKLLSRAEAAYRDLVSTPPR